MPIHILDEARAYLVHYLHGQHNQTESRHPWRRGWEFAVLHSLRVESYVTRILTRESHRLSEKEVTLIRLAAILHDLARLEKREGHARLGAEIAQKWLSDSSGSTLSAHDMARVVEMIADHSNKANPEPDISKAILKDADTLDEIGVMSIFMAANWVETNSPFFFHDLRQRLIDVEIPFFERKLAILNTKGAKEILLEKKAFMQTFIAQVTDELQADTQIEQLLFQITKNSDGGGKNHDG
jgi:uncharacterized protein